MDGSKRSDGTPRYELFVPPTTQGKHKIGLYGSSFTPRGILPDYYFDVIPAINIEPDAGNTGTNVTVTGTGFGANETISISYDNSKMDDTYGTDNQGNFTASITVPQSKGKEHIITATGDKGNSREATFTLLNEMTQLPQLTSPEKGVKIALFNSVGEVFRGTWKYLTNIRTYSKGTQNRNYTKTFTILDWSYGDGSTDMNYALQISQDNAFTSIILDEGNLNNSQYNLTEHGMLPKGTYFWRVKAVDSSGNESEWSEISQFEIISMTTMVFIFSILCLILIIAAIAFGILFLLANFNR
jgi:hypothetical protein